VKKRLPEVLLEEGARAVGRAASALLADPRGQEAVARAIGFAQRGLRLFGEAQERALHGAGFAARRDYRELRKQVARLKRKAREMSERLAAAHGGGDAAPPGDDGGGADDGTR
jgi:hypothetical protein